jgi:hypothetical protein
LHSGIAGVGTYNEESDEEYSEDYEEESDEEE